MGQMERQGIGTAENRETDPNKQKMERETRFELATFSLATRCSTTELLPLAVQEIYHTLAPTRQTGPGVLGRTPSGHN